jgi:hypothetical protein
MDEAFRSSLRSFFHLVAWGLAILLLLGGGGVLGLRKLWPERWYGMQNNIPIERVSVQPRPHDCDWGRAPLGDKGCHYEESVERLEDRDGPRLIVGWTRVTD